MVGFEDSVLARQTEPALTTVHQPVEAMGREMARLLVAHIRGEKVPAPWSSSTPTSSCEPPPEPTPRPDAPFDPDPTVHLSSHLGPSSVEMPKIYGRFGLPVMTVRGGFG